jgi:hypothetical protein
MGLGFTYLLLGYYYYSIEFSNWPTMGLGFTYLLLGYYYSIEFSNWPTMGLGFTYLLLGYYYSIDFSNWPLGLGFTYLLLGYYSIGFSNCCGLLRLIEYLLLCHLSWGWRLWVKKTHYDWTLEPGFSLWFDHSFSGAGQIANQSWLKATWSSLRLTKNNLRYLILHE